MIDYRGRCSYLVGEARDVLRYGVDEKSIHCVVTSPPYYGLRDYGLPPSIWGGDDDCSHEWDDREIHYNYGGATAKQATNTGSNPSKGSRKDATCSRCGAWKGCLGLEPEPFCWAFTRGENCGRCYLCHLRSVFAEVYRTLRDDGVLFLNIGDSFAGSGRGPTGHNGIGDQAKRQGFLPSNPSGGLPAKNQMGMPERVALALQADGWIRRDTIHLIKPAPMPESVKDRTTQAHEYLYVFTKSPSYYWDWFAIREEAVTDRKRGPNNSAVLKENRGSGNGHSGMTKFKDSDTRNPRNYMMWKNEPSRSKHYATFPRFLPRWCIRAATSEHGVCITCGAPWKRIVKPTAEYAKLLGKDWANYDQDAIEGRGHSVSEQRPIKRKGASVSASYESVGFKPTCSCYDELYRSLFPRTKHSRKLYQQDAANRWFKRARNRPGLTTWSIVPATVSDPFSGSGTTQVAAKEMDRQGLYIDLSKKYASIAQERIRGTVSGEERLTPVKKTRKVKVVPEQPNLL